MRLEDGRPFGAHLPMAAPGRGSEVKAGRRPPPEAARAQRAALRGASWPVTCGQVRAEGPLGEMGVQPCGLALSPAEPGQLPVKIYRYYYRFAPQKGSRKVPVSSAPKGSRVAPQKGSWISRSIIRLSHELALHEAQEA